MDKQDIDIDILASIEFDKGNHQAQGEVSDPVSVTKWSVI